MRVAILLCCLTFFLHMNPPESRGQESFNISVKTDVISSIELVTLQSIRISRANVINNVVTVNPLANNNAGKMVAMGAPNSEITISFQPSQELIHLNGTGSLTFNYMVAGNDVDDQSSAELLELQSRRLRFNSDGKFYIWIGGSVDLSTAEPGGYRGNFTLEIEYI